MASTSTGLRHGLAVATLLLAAGLAAAAPAPDGDAALRNQALALNQITGDDTIRGEITVLLEDKAAAKKLVTAAVKLLKDKKTPLNYNAAFILGSVAERVKDNDAALAYYRACLDEGSKLGSLDKISQSFDGLLAASFAAGKYADAAQLCREFLELPSKDDAGKTIEPIRRRQFFALEQLVRALAKLGKTKEANEVVDGFLKDQPDNWLLLELRGMVQREAGQYDDAAKTYEEVLSAITKDKALKDKEKTELANEMRYTLSGIYTDANKIDKATDQLRALLKSEPDNPGYNNDLGYIMADHDKNLDEAEKLIRKAIDEDKKKQKKDNPDLKADEIKGNPSYLDSLGWVLYKEKKYKEALAPLQEAVKDEDGQAIEIYDHLAEVHKALGDKAAAVGAWKKGLEHAGASKREQKKKTEVEAKIKESK